MTAIQQGRGEDLGHPSAVGGGVDVPDGGAVDGLAGLLHREPEPLRPLGPDQWGEPLRALRVDIHLLYARIVPGIAHRSRRDDRETPKALAEWGQKHKAALSGTGMRTRPVGRGPE